MPRGSRHPSLNLRLSLHIPFSPGQLKLLPPSSPHTFSVGPVTLPAALCNEPQQQTPPGWKPATAHLPQMLLEAEQKKLDGWYNKTTKDYWLWFAFQRLRSSFKCLRLHLSPRYRPAQASTFMVQDISKGLYLYFTAVRYQTLSFLMVIQSKL